MKKTLFALGLTLCLALAALAFSAKADTAKVLTVAKNGGDYKSVESALSAVETMAKSGELTEKGVRLVLSGTHTASYENGILFGQRTIFFPDGRKVPIAITGGTLCFPEGSVACTNDYTFTQITIPFDDTETLLFAGSGNITLEHITLNTNSKNEYKSAFYGDTFTERVFAGWTEKSLNLYEENGLFSSSVTLGKGFVYENTAGYRYAAVGASTDFSANIGKATLTAKDTAPKLIIDGAAVYNTMARIGTNPVGNSVLQVKSGTVNHLYAAGHGLATELAGDITVLTEGGSFRSFVRLLNNLTLRGNLTAKLCNMDLLGNSGEDGCMVEIGFSTVKLYGDVSVSMENIKADRYLGAMTGTANTVTGDVTTTAKNCEFTQFFYGGFGKGEIYGSVENRLEQVTLGNFKGADECTLLGKAASYTGKKDRVGDITNTLTEVTFSSATSVTAFMGNVSGSQAGVIRNSLNKVFTSEKNLVYCGNRSGTVKGIFNTVSDCEFSYAYYGGSSGGTVSEVRNTITDTVFYNYAYLAGGGATVSGPIENHLTDCRVTKYYTFGGVNGGKVINEGLEYGVKNYVSGGEYHGFWGGSASSAATHRGNVYTEVSSGDFYGYEANKNFSFSGGCRNTRHQGNTYSLIRGGTFHGYVAGGSIPNSEDYKKDHVGVASLTLAGGTFLDTVNADSRWGGYTESHLNADTTYALEQMTFVTPIEFESYLAGSSRPTQLTGTVKCGTMTLRGTGAFHLNGKVTCDSFTVEDTAPAPYIYGRLTCGTLSLGKTINLGARSVICAERVTGAVHLNQTEYWLKQVYFTSPATTAITLSREDGVLGEANVKNGVVTGFTTAFAGASFIFSDQVSLRFAFDTDWVDASRDDFSFTAVIGNRTLADSIRFSDLVLKGGYYTYRSEPLNAAELGEEILCYGNLIPEYTFTLTELAANGVKIYGKEGSYKALGTLLKAFSNYAVATDNYKNARSTPLPYDNLAEQVDFESTDGFAPMIANPLVTLTDKQLVLDGGMRIRYYLKSAETSSSSKNTSPVKDLYYFHNCADITANAVTEWIPTSSTKGYFKITVDLPVYPSKSREAIRFMVSDKENMHLALPVDTTAPYTSYIHEDYVDRLDTFAEALSQTEGSRELGSALLYYLQAGADYYKTQPDLSSFTYPETFSAGYAREDISPYGFEVDLSSSKISTAVLDPLYTTCLAIWDGEELALYFGVDVRQCPAYLTSNAKNLLAEEFDIDPDKIFFNATHNHSSPNTTSESRADMKKWYSEIFFPATVLAARKAVLDLAPATLYTGTANSDPGTNFVRRYVNADGTYTGIHNIVPATNVVGYETEADKELRTLRFDRGGKTDILFVNWQGHAAHGAAYDHAATADFVGFLRDGVEAELGVHFIYCNGASGNLNFTPKTQADKNAKYFTSPYFQGVGKSLVGTVKKAVAAEKSIQSGKLCVTYIPYQGVVRHDDEATVAKANECYEAAAAYKKEKGASPSASWYQKNYGFQSSYEVSAIRTRAGLGEVETIPVYAFSFGDVGMAFAPYEMFDTNGQQIRAASPFAVTMVGGYTNGTHSYVPSSYAAPHNGYEVYTCRYVFSTGDSVAASLAEALTQMHQNAK